MTLKTAANISLTALACTTIGTITFAEDLMPVATVEGWAISRDANELGCVMEKVNEDGYFIRIGKTEAGDPFGYVAVYAKDRDLEVYGNVSKAVSMDIDGQRFSGKATGDFKKGQYRGAYVKADNPNFGKALAKKYVLTLNPDGENPIKLSLDGTYKAMAATSDCEADGLANAYVQDGGNQADLTAAAAASLTSLLANNDRAARISQDAKATLVFPEITKVGLGIGGEGGNGVLTIGGQTQGYYRTSSVSIGAIAGAQKYGYAVMFLSDAALEKFTSSRGYELGVDGSIAIMDAAASATVDTTNLKVDTVAFIFDEKGLMADLSVKGTRIKPLDTK